MAAIPEEFPLVFTLYLSLAAYRLSKLGILVKSLPAVEGLGRVDIICTDKTGTLTEGKFRLQNILGATGELSLSAEEWRALIFSCEPKAVDAMEASIFTWVNQHKGPNFIPELHTSWSLRFDFPFDTKQKYMSHVWRNEASGEETIAMKGALEGVLAHCRYTPAHAAIMEIAQREAEAGKRILGLAERSGNFSGIV